MMRRNWAGVFLAVLLVACGGGSNDLPPVRPSSVVSGNAVDAAIQNGAVAVYAFGANGKGELLGGGVTDADGFYALELQARSQPVLIEVSGGHYVEEASGVTVNLAEGQVLRAVARYVSGQPLSVMVTPLTHLAAGLAEYRVTQGVDAGAAVDGALASLSSLFNLQVTAVLPRSIADPRNVTTQLSDPHRYGFLLAALSSFTQWASAQNNAPVHTAYTSMALSQILFNDIRADGLLDGLGFNKAGDALMNLAFGVVALNQDVYRIAFAQHLLAISGGAQNKTGLTRADLREGARGLATSAHALFGGAVPAASSLFGPAIVPLTPEGAAFNGAYDFKVVIDSVLEAETVTFDIDGVVLGNAADAANPAFVIDTRAYQDGEYTVGVAATDFLGFRSYRQFKYRFDNIFVNITSPAATNQAAFTLRGNYGDKGQGLQALTVQGKPVSLAADKTWSVDVQLQPGRNILAMVITTGAGVVEQSEAVVDLDLGAPKIDTSAGQIDALFSRGDGSFVMAPLADVNSGAPLYIETDHAELAGVPLQAASLASNRIPYFSFVASDPLLNGVGTPEAELLVRMQYEKNNAVMAPWRMLSAVDGRYLLPLATETLHASWLNSTPNDIHALRVEVTDKAGNRVTTLFTFKIDFIVAPFDVGAVSDAASGFFSNISFAERESVYGANIAVMEYQFINTTGKTFYVNLEDSGAHTARNTIEELVRENKVRLKSTPEWRAGFIENVLQWDQCPSLPKDGGVDKWAPVSQVLNNGGVGKWNPVKVPEPSFGEIEPVSADTKEPPLPSAWKQVPDTFFVDAIYEKNTSTIASAGTLNYEFDYILNLPSIFRPAAVRNWKFVDNTGPLPVTTTCPNVNFLQQREVKSYESLPGFPRNVRSEVNESLPMASSFEVFDLSANKYIQAVSGWYLIPAGHTAAVRKRVTLPSFTLRNETEVTDPGFKSYTPHRYDLALEWTVQRPVVLNVAHDAGVGNLFSMTARDVQVGEGEVVYQLAR